MPNGQPRPLRAPPANEEAGQQSYELSGLQLQQLLVLDFFLFSAALIPFEMQTLRCRFSYPSHLLLEFGLNKFILKFTQIYISTRLVYL